MNLVLIKSSWQQPSSLH